MASRMLRPRGGWLPLLLVLLLLLLQPGQHSKNKESTTTTKPPTTTADPCKNPGEVGGHFVIVYCRLDNANVAEIFRRPEVMDQDPGCVNSTSLPPQCQQLVDKNCSSLADCLVCEEPCPVQNLIQGDQTNHSVTLHWQYSNDCCYKEHRGSATTVPKASLSYCTANIPKLSPGQSYNMTVFRKLDGQCSKESSITAFTCPSPVPYINIQNRTVDALQVEWAPPEDPHASRYRYKVCLPGCHNASGNLLWVRNLTPGETYSVEVFAISANNVSSARSTKQATTAPNAPKNIRVSHCETNSIPVSWHRPKDPHAANYSYWVSWRSGKGANLSGNISVGVDRLSYNITPLLPGILYLVKLASEVVGVKSKEASKWALTCPLPPRDFRVHNSSQTAIELSWKKPSSAFSNFQLRWKNLNESNDKVKRLGDSTETTLRGLTPSSNYTFTLLSVAEGENKTAYSVGVVQEGATKPDHVNNLKCDSSMWGDRLLLSWTCPASKVSKLQVCLSDQLVREWTICEEETEIDNLQPAWSYLVQVQTFWYEQEAASAQKMCTTSNTGVILETLLPVLLFSALLSLLLFYFWRKRAKNVFEKQRADMGLPRALDSVPVLAFPVYCHERFSNSGFGFAEEYQQLQDVGTGQPQSVAERPENQAKNRYSNVLPYDHSRVQLTIKSGDPNSDYINASYMPGFEREKEFIAAQGPLPGTLYDFWRMIWEQQIVTMVMLTNCAENGRVKCERYWPLDYTPCTYDNITVSVITETILPDWTIRDFTIKQVNLSEVHLARHYHYTSWPDHGVPKITSTILHFRDLVRAHIEEHRDAGPALVHCSAGVGRTGTFISLDSLLRQAQVTGELGVFSFVRKLRMNRPLMIQTESQFIFLHQCLLDALRPPPQSDSEKTEHTAVYENTWALQGYEVSRV
ncbi:receptor-type tyrosine-protein phosphatase H [Zootoca vivipara]|uniref:receptor-type tyrosine-protein phosphatase H n=1 Tax=Zootoca vivipara TaxID=8524 RepID=UPI001590D7B6|nr:receptor-type tyrosine-protein phosphatase H [Zootoca vivipara]